MTNVDTNDIAATADEAATPSTMVQIALKNAAGTIEVDTARLPDDVYREALMQGLKVIAERGMSKITKANIPDEAERRAEIKAKAEANVQDMYEHTAEKPRVKITGATKVKKASGAVMTEAMRLARNLIKDAMKANKIKISTVKSSEITKAAKAYIESNPSIVATAEKNLQEREQTPMTLDIKSLIKVDPELVAKAEKKAAEAKASKPLSAKQAGKVAPRAKGAKPMAQANA